MNIISNNFFVKEPLFDKIVLKTNQNLPENLDLSGSIAFTRDTKHTGWIHKILYIAQRITAFLQQKKEVFDPNYCHGLIILNHDKIKKNNLVIAHSVLGKESIRTASRNYLQDREVTELVIYRPRDKKIRELMTQYGYQTSYTNPKYLPENEREAASKKEKGQFSVANMFISLVTPQKLQRKVDARISLLAADLLMGQQFKTANGKKQEAMYCTPYALAVLQGSLVVNALTDKEKITLKNLGDRQLIASALSKRLDQPDESWKNKVFHIKTDYAMSAHVVEILDSLCLKIS